MTMAYAIINGQVKLVMLGEVIDAVGVFARRHPGHKVYDNGMVHYLSDELIYNTEERARKELAHLNRIWGDMVVRQEGVMTNKELLEHLEYEERIHRELHGVNAPSAVKAREALERVKELVKESPAMERA